MKIKINLHIKNIIPIFAMRNNKRYETEEKKNLSLWVLLRDVHY